MASVQNPLSSDLAVSETYDRWRRELARLGGPDPLLYFVDEDVTRLELSSAHPGGLPQFIVGRTTFLSSLIRDEISLRVARVAAANLVAKDVELLGLRGLNSIMLAIGLCKWQFEGRDFCAPILLRPMAMRGWRQDFQLKLKGMPSLNPALARVLARQFGINLTADELVHLVMDSGSFKPQPVIDYMRQLTASIQNFRVLPRLLVSSFASVAYPLLEDFEAVAAEGVPIIRALAGDDRAQNLLMASRRPVTLAPQDERSPTADYFLLDADGEQEEVVAQIAAGNSVVVKTLPGSGSTQTLVNAIGVLVAQNKRVLVAGPRQVSLGGLIYRLRQIGLPSLVVSTKTLRRDLLTAIGRNEKAKSLPITEVDDALVRLRRILLDYRRALSRPDEQLGITAQQALESLASLALLPDPPSTKARLDRFSLEKLAHGRQEVAELLETAAGLGEFRYGPKDSPWYGANFGSNSEAQEAHAAAKALASTELPLLLERAWAMVGQTKMRPFETLEELGIYLELLTELRQVLDHFSPEIFDRSLSELIAATSSRRNTPQMPSARRRQLKKLAREYLLPQAPPGDIHAQLERIQQLRAIWHRYVPVGVLPEIPVGLADVALAYREVGEALALLDKPLGRAEGNLLSQTPIEELGRLIEGLGVDSEVMNNLQERASIRERLRELRLDPLLEDLSNRHVSGAQVSVELELAWWRSSLEWFLKHNPALLGGQTSVLDRLENDFRQVDRAHTAASAVFLAWSLAETWRVGVVDWPEESTQLKELLRHDSVNSKALELLAPRLNRVLTPVWAASNYEVPSLPKGMRFDTVFLLDAGGMSVAESLAALARADQVVVFGDLVTQNPSFFRTRLEPNPPSTSPISLAALHEDSALARLSKLLPEVELRRSYRASGDDLSELINRHFYGGRLETMPWAGSFLGRRSLIFHHVDEGIGLPDPQTGMVEGIEAEVRRVISLVLDAANRPGEESVMVITPSARHASRIREALAEVQDREDLAEFFSPQKPEPFVVLTPEQAVSYTRDRVIFSLGFGRTPRGRVLSEFGSLSKPGGERLVAVSFTSARSFLEVVSCFHFKEVDLDKLEHGARALMKLLSDAEYCGLGQPDTRLVSPLIQDLVSRLEALGLRVRAGFRGKLPLVAGNQSRAVVVDFDDGEGSLRELLSLRPELLRQLGWRYIKIHSFELFSDPKSVVSRVLQVLDDD